MVLLVTINPLLEKKLFFKNIEKGNNRAYRQEYSAGGKGINISRQLNNLNIKNHNLIFLGGANGKRLRSVLESENISFSVVSTKDDTREATLVYNEKEEELSTYFGLNSNILQNEIDHFIDKLEKAIINSSIVVFAGSLPNKECSIIIERGIELCNKHDKISIIDSYGEMLLNQIEKGPTVLHNNIDEITSSLKKEIKVESDFEEILNYLFKKNIKLSFLTSGKKDTFCSKSDFHYKISNPDIIEKDATGSGDAFVSGIIYGLEKSLVFNEFATLASALGAANASKWDICNSNYAEAEKYFDKISIKEIGKKIKIIDDSPTI